MKTGKFSDRARRTFALMVAALAALLCLAAAQAVPAAQAAAPAGHITQAAQARPAGLTALTALTVASPQARRVHLMVPADCTQDCYTYSICLTYSSSHCLAFPNTTLSTVYLEPEQSSTSVVTWKTINSSDGDQTQESEGTDTGYNEGVYLCLAANDTSSSGGAQVYLTSNCGGNPFASWECVENGDGCNYYNVNSLDYGREYMLTALNTRDGAFIYVEPARAGTWQNWGWFNQRVCLDAC
jgi:hypothetical protein